jgi:helix-turn-helix protein
MAQKPRDPRVEIAPDLHRALIVEAAIAKKKTTPKDLVAKWIMANLSEETKKICKISDDDTKGAMERNPIIPSPQEQDKAETMVAQSLNRPKAKSKTKEPIIEIEDEPKVKELLSKGVKFVEIGRLLGYSGTQISKFKKSLIESGELK